MHSVSVLELCLLARTFWAAQERARASGGELILRNEDLDSTRYKMEFVQAMMEDLRWFGFEWSEGPDCGGPFAPYNQSERMDFYRAALEKLRAGNFIYPCTCSRKDIQAATRAPHANDDDEPIYPGTCRTKFGKLANSANRKVRLAFSRSRWRDDFIRGWKFGRATIRGRKRFWRFCGLARRRCSGVSARLRGGRRGDANHRGRARRGFARQHRAADSALSRAGTDAAGIFSIAS